MLPQSRLVTEGLTRSSAMAQARDGGVMTSQKPGASGARTPEGP